MTNFDFISRKVFFICTVNGDGVTINNTNYTTIDLDLLSQAELAVIAKGVQFMEIECSNPSAFDTYLSENSTGSTSGSLDTRYYTEAEIDSYFAGLTKSSVGLSNVQNVDTTTTLNINSSTDKRFVTDAQLTVIGNTSNTNTGDETTASVKTKLGTSSTTTDGYLTSTDWNTFNDKQNLITAGTISQYRRGDNTWATLDKSAVGLSSVANVDTTNASNISSGTLANERLTTNLSQIGNETFANGEVVQSFGGVLQNASLASGVTGMSITNSAGQILFDAPYAKGPLNQKSGFFEDFITFSATTISQILARSVTGVGATTAFVTPGNSNDYRNGIISFSTGITTTGAASAISGSGSFINFANIPVGGYEEIAANIKIPTLSDGTNTFSVIVGFGDGTTTLPVDGAYISISTSGATLNTRSNSITSNTTAVAVSAATEYIVKVVVQNTGGTLTALGYLNGALIGSLTTNIPSGAGRHTGIQVGIIKSLGTTSRTIEVDWVNYETYRPRTINY